MGITWVGARAQDWVACPPPSAEDALWMAQALDLARQAAAAGEVPVGALIVQQGRLVAAAFNQPIGRNDPCAHAEILALRQAGERLGNYRLPGCELYVTLEPCPMCAGALVHARIQRLIYATPDPRTGAAGSLFNLLQDSRLNHQVAITKGPLGEASAQLLRDFFRARRAAQKGDP